MNYTLSLITMGILSLVGAHPSCAGVCDETDEAAKSCITVDYQLKAKNYAEAQKAVQGQLQTFELIAKQEKLGTIELDSQSTNFFTDVIDSQTVITIGGRANYKLKTPQSAERFIKILEEKLYTVEPYQQGC